MISRLAWRRNVTRVLVWSSCDVADAIRARNPRSSTNNSIIFSLPFCLHFPKGETHVWQRWFSRTVCNVSGHSGWIWSVHQSDSRSCDTQCERTVLQKRSQKSQLHEIFWQKSTIIKTRHLKHNSVHCVKYLVAAMAGVNNSRFLEPRWSGPVRSGMVSINLSNSWKVIAIVVSMFSLSINQWHHMFLIYFLCIHPAVTRVWFVLWLRLCWQIQKKGERKICYYRR